jgi:hypothetical protein
MNSVTRKPSLGAGRFSKSMEGVCSVTVTSLSCWPDSRSAADDADRERGAHAHDQRRYAGRLIRFSRTSTPSRRRYQ